MEVPRDDYDISVMIRAVKEVQELLTSKQLSTYTEVDKEISNTLRPYESLGDGFESIRLYLTKDVANSHDLKNILIDMNARCEAKLKDFECSQKDQINDILPFVSCSSRILVHGCGGLLGAAIACAIQEREGVHFYICEGRPTTTKYPEGTGAALLQKAAQTPEGMRLQEKLLQSCTIIPDAGVGAVMSKIDFVVMGAYCVTEHGGLVHSTGSLQIATVASAMNVPFYVLCETFKFARIFPLSTADLKQPEGCDVVPFVEFVPPSMVALVFSEQGIMPPSAVTNEMFRFHTARFAPGILLNEQVDLSFIQTWNAVEGVTAVARVFDPHTQDNGEPLRSDADPELLLLVPLKQVCRLRGVSILGTNDDFAPSQVKILCNPVNITGFDSVRRLQFQEDIQLAQVSQDDKILYRLNPVKFSNTSNIAFLFEQSFGGEETHLLRIDLYGESTGKPVSQQVATNVVYEAMANPADHNVSQETRKTFAIL